MKLDQRLLPGQRMGGGSVFANGVNQSLGFCQP
jgi:hypothetical protein